MHKIGIYNISAYHIAQNISAKRFYKKCPRCYAGTFPYSLIIKTVLALRKLYSHIFVKIGCINRNCFVIAG